LSLKAVDFPSGVRGSDGNNYGRKVNGEWRIEN
jgi:hypothetical protein